MADRTGYVMDFKLQLVPLPGAGDNGVFFRVTLADDLAGAQQDEYRLVRNISSAVVDHSQAGSKELWAQSYGSIELGIIAMLKDALLHDKRVTITYTDTSPELAFVSGVSVDNRISAVRLHRT